MEILFEVAVYKNYPITDGKAFLKDAPQIYIYTRTV
jgi:hypothetical protein